MNKGSYYIYALKDPRTSPARPFYIGKGTGIRAWEHVINIDGTRKGKRIQEIVNDGFEVITVKLVEDLDEMQALKLEAELISSYGTEANGGFLTNAVIPSGAIKRNNNAGTLIIPSGVTEKAQLGLKIMKESILELALANPKGIRNTDAVKALGLQSDYLGGSKDYLTWSLLGLLMREGRMKRLEGSKKHIATVR